LFLARLGEIGTHPEPCPPGERGKRGAETKREASNREVHAALSNVEGSEIERKPLKRGMEPRDKELLHKICSYNAGWGELVKRKGEVI